MQEESDGPTDYERLLSAFDKEHSKKSSLDVQSKMSSDNMQEITQDSDSGSEDEMGGAEEQGGGGLCEEGAGADDRGGGESSESDLQSDGKGDDSDAGKGAMEEGLKRNRKNVHHFLMVIMMIWWTVQHKR